MAEKITWIAPTETTITQVEINRASSLYGTYSVIATIAATSDGLAKSSTNTWVVNYTDITGNRTDWYKIRFYDGTSTLYSEYSDPTTSEELLRLCTIDDIKKTIDVVGRWTDDQIFDAITEEDTNIFIEFGTPIRAVWTETGRIDSDYQYIYYVGEENIYRVDRVFYGTATKVEYYLDDGYKVNAKNGMVKILSVASGGPELTSESDLEIQYVPKVFNKLATLRTCKSLLEQIDEVSGGKTSKELDVITKKLNTTENIVANMYAFGKSSDFEHYDDTYGVNRKHLIQDHFRNRYIDNPNAW